MQKLFFIHFHINHSFSIKLDCFIIWDLCFKFNLASNELYFLKVVGLSALACGMIAVGSCNDVVTSAIIQVLHEKTEADLKDTFARFLPLALGLCYLGKKKCHI